MTPPPDLDRLLADVREEASSEDPLDLLAAATTTRDTLTDAAEAMLDHFVEVARDAGCSWTEIGNVLGVSKQAAQQRSMSPGAIFRRLFQRLRDPGLFRRFSSEARDAVVAARVAATDLGHPHVGTEHLLLGLLGVDDSPAAGALTAAGVTQARVRALVAERVPPSEEGSGRVQFTPRAKKVLELALRESIRGRSQQIGAEHLLRGLLREGGGEGMQVLDELGVDVDVLRADLDRRPDPHG